MLNDRQIAKIHKRIAHDQDLADAARSQLHLAGLGAFARFLPPSFEVEAGNVAARFNIPVAEAKVHLKLANHMAHKTKLATIEARIDLLKSRLERNGTPYAQPVADAKFIAKLEGDLRNCEGLIAGYGNALANFRADLSDEQAEMMVAAKLVEENNRRRLLRRLGRDVEAAPAGQ